MQVVVYSGHKVVAHRVCPTLDEL